MVCVGYRFKVYGFVTQDVAGISRTRAAVWGSRGRGPSSSGDASLLLTFRMRATIFSKTTKERLLFLDFEWECSLTDNDPTCRRAVTMKASKSSFGKSNVGLRSKGFDASAERERIKSCFLY